MPPFAAAVAPILLNPLQTLAPYHTYCLNDLNEIFFLQIFVNFKAIGDYIDLVIGEVYIITNCFKIYKNLKKNVS